MSDLLLYRLYKVETRKCNDRKVMLTGQLAGQSMEDFIYTQMIELMTPVMRRASAFIKPEDLQPITDEENLKGTPCFCVKDCRKIGKVLVASITFGHYGDKDWLYDRFGEPENISQKAASSLYEVRMAFPETKQNEPDKNVCYMACTVNGRSAQGENLLQYISYRYHLSISKVSKDNPSETIATGEWYRFSATPVIDRNRFDSVMASAKPRKIELEMHSVSGFGSRESQKLTLTVSSVSAAWRIRVNKVLKKWIKAVQKKSSLSRLQGAQDVAALMPKDGLQLPKKMINNGGITYEENGKIKTVTAETVDQLFIYPMSDGSTIEDLWKDAGNNLRLIAAADDGKYDLPALNVDCNLSTTQV